jgi:predicted O-methyltransferase YrrM
MSFDCTAGFARWIADLEARQLRDLTMTEVARALRALSSTYVERRARLSGRGAFDSAGKRAAYALYYGPRRFLTIGRVLDGLAVARAPRAIVDLGCGTGAAGAAWACHAGDGSTVTGLDVHPWALAETRATLRAFSIDGTVRRAASGERGAAAAALRSRPGQAPPALALSYVVNELDEASRTALLEQILAAAATTAVLVIEPIARRTSPWWPRWVRAVTAAGGRHDEWRLRLAPPAVTAALGRAAGLDPDEATARTLWLAPPQRY